MNEPEYCPGCGCELVSENMADYCQHCGWDNADDDDDWMYEDDNEDDLED